MKFRGKIIDSTYVKHFSQLVHLIAKMAKLIVMRLTKTHIYFIIVEANCLNGKSQPSLWAEIEEGHFFNEYDMVGVSQENNEIFFELNSEKLAKILNSLKSPQAIRSLKMKLTKKHASCLTFEVELPSLSANSRIVVHDIPVTLIPRRLWQIYQEPQMPVFEASIYLPPLRQLRHIFERMKAISNQATLIANGKGTLIISVSTDGVEVSTYFRNLAIPNWERNDADRDLNKLHSATIDLKKLCQFLQGELINPNRVICNIVEDKLIHMFLFHDNIALQYFLPSVAKG